MSSASDPHAEADRQKAQMLFKYGNDAALKDNYDYAIQMYRDACKLHPDNLLYRKALRGIERRKFGNEPAKVGRLVGARNQPIRMRARGARGKGHHTQALEICEEAFAHNPWDVAAAREAAEAAEQLGWNELAQWLLESVAGVANDADFFRYMAHVHELNASWQKAIAAWERVKKIHPYDEDANRQINALAASATIQRSGLGDALHKRAAAAGSSGPEPRDADLDELRQPQLSPEERWEKEIQEDPTLVGPYLQYAEHLKMRGQLDQAEKLLARGLKAAPDDPALKRAHAEVQIGRIQRAIASWQRKCRERPDDEAARAKLAQLEAMLADYEIEEYRRRIGQNPGDAHLQYELGLRLAKAGQHKEAIAAFQQAARSSPAVKVEALLHAGQSFEAEGALKLAERSYHEALKAAEDNDVATLNALHYRLGRVAEAMGNTTAAEEHYNEVAANDYGYLDVAQRLRSLS
jgi:tetratricopeptide (TPR) repeat protein